MIGILAQSTNSQEIRIVRQVALLEDGIEYRSCKIEEIEGHRRSLMEGRLMPVGSVEFIRQCFALLDIQEPPPLDYPPGSQRFTRRQIRCMKVSDFSSKKPMFIKPFITKQFPSMVRIGSLGSGARKCLRVTPDDWIWVSDTMPFSTEVRYYVQDKQVIGEGRYDQREEDLPLPDRAVVDEAVRSISIRHPYSIDFGVVRGTGETALVECNDAWAVGYYKGTLTPRQYYSFLAARWEGIIDQKTISHWSPLQAAPAMPSTSV